MTYTRRTFLYSLAAAPLALGVVRPAWSAAAKPSAYPERPIKFIVPFSAGSSTDIAARVYANLAANIAPGASVVVENRAGAGGNVGASVVARSDPDGYSIMYSAATPYVIAPFVYSDLPFDPIRDLMPIAVTISVPVFLVVSGESDIRTLDDLRMHIRAKKQSITYGSNGVGTSSHIICKALATKLGDADLVHVPYKQGSQAVMSDVIGGRLTYAVDPWSVVGPLVQSGRLRAIAVTNGTRLSVAPDIPTLSELLGKEFEIVTWNGLWAPTGTPTEIIDRLGRAIAAAGENRALAQQFESQGTPLMPAMSLAETKAFMTREIQRWKALVQTTGIKL